MSKRKKDTNKNNDLQNTTRKQNIEQHELH